MSIFTENDIEKLDFRKSKNTCYKIEEAQCIITYLNQNSSYNSNLNAKDICSRRVNRVKNTFLAEFYRFVPMKKIILQLYRSFSEQIAI